jgi:hypothetical protein
VQRRADRAHHEQAAHHEHAGQHRPAAAQYWW